MITADPQKVEPFASDSRMIWQNISHQMQTAFKNLVAILLIILAGSVTAQRTGFGIKGGVQACTYRVINIRTTMIPGLTMGIYVPILAAPRFEFQPELLLTTMGTGLIEPDGDRYFVRSLYLQAPVSAKIFLTNSINLQGGVQFGKFLLAHKYEANKTTNLGDEYRSFDMGFNLGIGFDSYRGTDITIRYYSGMPTVWRYDQALYPRNRSLQLTIGKRLVKLRQTAVARKRK